ncbi:Tubulin-specific chaperone A [Lachancea thermotolerans]|uniref:Tubulin-specific chaperone A n=1 Tax=Lachancea thermotolerans (strain ATCC 56472 / CBS 6340 / NRRL Y-8284) TaxID=559295 RepID=C5DF45_LACTC|nr:KLTH0D12122p [Lachancea thermotolerans CBS 6340]CAR22800.1 KLTH0D12122p [Lachancea thermotolerans CBS 6340]
MAPSQLEIKVRSLQRLVKEEKYYQQELSDQKAHVENLKANSEVDPYDLKKQVEVLQDTQRLLPALYEKIGQFKEDLVQFTKTYSGSEDLGSSKQVLKEAADLLEQKR